jgi:hypothetical protein
MNYETDLRVIQCKCSECGSVIDGTFYIAWGPCDDIRITYAYCVDCTWIMAFALTDGIVLYLGACESINELAETHIMAAGGSQAYAVPVGADWDHIEERTTRPWFPDDIPF